MSRVQLNLGFIRDLEGPMGPSVKPSLMVRRGYINLHIEVGSDRAEMSGATMWDEWVRVVIEVYT